MKVILQLCWFYWKKSESVDIAWNQLKNMQIKQIFKKFNIKLIFSWNNIFIALQLLNIQYLSAAD